MEMASLPIGMSTSGDYYCFFPMPYWSSAQLQLVNNSGGTVSIPFEVQYTTNASRIKSGADISTPEHKRQVIGHDGQDINFLTTQGRGHFVGAFALHLRIGFHGQQLRSFRRRRTHLF